MINLTEIAITFLIVMLGNKIQDNYKPDQLEIHLSNGRISYVSINKGNYSCPKNCGAKHYHKTSVSKQVFSETNYQIYYDISNSYLKLNNSDIIDIYEIKTKKIKKSKKVSTKREKLEIAYFISRFDL